jgi:hypothetical protein
MTRPSEILAKATPPIRRSRSGPSGWFVAAPRNVPRNEARIEAVLYEATISFTRTTPSGTTVRISLRLAFSPARSAEKGWPVMSERRGVWLT